VNKILLSREEMNALARIIRFGEIYMNENPFILAANNDDTVSIVDGDSLITVVQGIIDRIEAVDSNDPDVQ